jgi:hypothetical protein
VVVTGQRMSRAEAQQKSEMKSWIQFAKERYPVPSGVVDGSLGAGVRDAKALGHLAADGLGWVVNKTSGGVLANDAAARMDNQISNTRAMIGQAIRDPGGVLKKVGEGYESRIEDIRTNFDREDAEGTFNAYSGGTELAIEVVSAAAGGAVVLKQGAKGLGRLRGAPEFNDRDWMKSDGTWDWPPNNGFAGTPKVTTLKEGMKFDRISERPPEFDTGGYLAPVGTAFEKRALPPGYEDFTRYEYRVLKDVPPDLNVQVGKTAKYFGHPGGGTQFLLPKDKGISWLIENKYIAVEKVHPPFGTSKPRKGGR